MKANTPEKVYINFMHKTLMDMLSVKVNNDDIEYVRKDDFIEKACAWLNENLIYYWEQLNANDTAEFLNDFKNYMKEE